jgi:hypothetical protein
MLQVLYLRCAHLQVGFEIQNVYFHFAKLTCKSLGLKVSKKSERALKSTLRKNGYSEQTADEIWKWYTFKEKK